MYTTLVVLVHLIEDAATNKEKQKLMHFIPTILSWLVDDKIIKKITYRMSKKNIKNALYLKKFQDYQKCSILLFSFLILYSYTKGPLGDVCFPRY